MNISKAQVETILKTLPIGYYIKRDVPVKLTDDSSSYYDPMNDTISLSYPQLAETFSHLPDTTTNVEHKIRCLLYHETSHAFLTPKNLKPTDVINIFEDERIESALRHYYRDVDFRAFVKEINDFKGEPPKTALSFFYQIVRYRLGPKLFVNHVHDLILRHQHIYDNDRYKYDIENFYAIVKEYFERYEKDIKKHFEKNLDNEGDMIDSNSTDDKKDDDKKEDETNAISTIKSYSDEFDKRTDKRDEFNEFDNSEILLTEKANKYVDSNIINDMFDVFNNYKKITDKNNSAINTYSGIFDAKSVIRDDYKFFLQKNRNGHNKAYSNIHLNLFIDCSGSFHASDKIINKMLFALNKVEKRNPDFTYDLISCGMGQVIRDKKDKIQFSSGGNDLDDEIFEQYKKVQHKHSQNINVVCFDGDAFSDTSYRRHVRRDLAYKNFSAFNFNNCIIISSRDNSQAIDEYASNAKRIYTRDYSRELYKAILQSLKQLCK